MFDQDSGATHPFALVATRTPQIPSCIAFSRACVFAQAGHAVLPRLRRLDGLTARVRPFNFPSKSTGRILLMISRWMAAAMVAASFFSGPGARAQSFVNILT